jgi:hypothetical protein
VSPRTIGPVQILVERLAEDPETLAAIRAEFDALMRPYYSDNLVH